MSKMEEILAVYRDHGNISQDEKDIVNHIIDIKNHNNEAVQTVSQGFLRIDKALPSEPVDLFGNVVPSRAHNRISVHADIEGPALFSVLLSDNALSNLVMNPNTSDSKAEMTLERVAGKLVAGTVNRAADPYSTIETFVEETKNEQYEKALKFAERLAGLKKGLGKKDLEETANAVKNGFISRDTSFVVSQYQEAAVEHAAVLRSEAANLIRNAHLLNNLDMIEYDQPVDAEQIPEVRTLLGEDAAENIITAKAIKFFLSKIAQDFELKYFNPASSDDIDNLKRAMRNGGKRDVDDIDSLARTLSSLLRDKPEKPRELRHFIGHLTHTTGSVKGLHSDFGPTDNMIKMDFSAARIDTSFGQSRLRDALHTPFVQLYLAPVDIMNALRSESAGQPWTRCTISMMYGQKVPHIEYTHPLEQKNTKQSEVSTNNILQAPAVQSHLKAARALADHIKTTGLSSVASRTEAARMAEDLARVVPVVNDMVFDEVREQLNVVSDHVEEDLRDRFKLMMESREALALGQSGGDVERLLLGS